MRDQYGILNIYAPTTEDLFAAQGMSMPPSACGRWRSGVASVRAALRAVRRHDPPQRPYIRTLGWREAAEKDWDVMTDEGKKALQAYAAASTHGSTSTATCLCLSSSPGSRGRAADSPATTRNTGRRSTR